jgi:hypothetical protein
LLALYVGAVGVLGCSSSETSPSTALVEIGGSVALSTTAGTGGSNATSVGSGMGGGLGQAGTQSTSISTGTVASGGQTPAAGGATASNNSTATGGSTGTSGSTSTGGAAVTGGTKSTGGSTSTGGTGTGGSTLPPHVCDEPTPWTVPATTQVVGTGTAASCTYSALNSKVTAGGYVTFNCGTAPVTIAVTSAITVNKATVVDGAGLVTLDGGGNNQIFLVASNYSLSVRNLTFINGKAPAVSDATGIGGAVLGNWRSQVEVIGCTFNNNTAGRGGGAVGVWTGSSLTIVSSRFSGNSSWYGGAVYSLYSPLQVINCEFTNNSTVLQSGYGDGGAIGTDGATTDGTTVANNGTIQICGTRISNNQGNGSGGGAYLWMYPPDQTIIDRTTVESNTVTLNASNQGGIGGAMRISDGTITIKASSFLSNTSVGNGGGLYLDCTPTCTITNSTFYANKNTAGWGGAIFNGTLSTNNPSINNVTFAGNLQQNTQGNALFGNITTGTSWSLNNSIFYNNGCATKGTGAHVLEYGSSSTCLTGAISGDPLLGTPANNGGPTYTMLPGAGSAALSAGANCEATDQRGQTRNTAVCDVGSVEVP